MTTTTRSRGVEAFEHVIINVLKLNKSSQLWKALEDDGFDTISDIATLTDSEINALKYGDVDTNGNITMKTVMKKQRKLLTHLLSWRDWTSRQLKEFDVDDWFRLISDDFNNFRENQLPDIVRGGLSISNTSSSLRRVKFNHLRNLSLRAMLIFRNSTDMCQNG